MPNPQLQLFTDPAVLYHAGPKLLRTFFKRIIARSGGEFISLNSPDGYEFAIRIPYILENHPPSEPFFQAMAEVEALAAPENWPNPRSLPVRDWDAPENPEAYRLYKALHRWLELHPETPAPEVLPAPPLPPPQPTVLPLPPGEGRGEGNSATTSSPIPPTVPLPSVTSFEVLPTPPLPPPQPTILPLPPADDRGEGNFASASPPPPETDDQTFSRLARLSPADYDRVRDKEARRLRIRGVTLDKEVRRRRAQLDDDTQAHTVKLPILEPWPEPILDAPALFHQVAERFTLRIVLPDGGAPAVVLWLAHTHVLPAFHLTPRLNLLSPRGGCGKTTTLELLATMVPRPFSIDNLRPAVLFRVVHLQQPTLLLDEVDTYLRRMTELRGLLNAGHRSGSHAYRCEGPGKAIRGFRAYAAAALAGIGTLPPTLRDRSIRIPLVEAKPGEVQSPFDRGNTQLENELGRKVARWAKDNFAAIKAARPPLPKTAHNRLADNWRPLLALAHVIGGDWPARAVAAFDALNTQPPVEDTGLILLGDIRQVFTQCALPRLFSADLVNALCALPNRPYADSWGRNGNARRLDEPALARALSPYGVRPHYLRIEGAHARGYDLADFTASFAQLPSLKTKQPPEVPAAPK